jgi:ADP-heptose:LPS heptosyltransferase
MNLDQRIRHLNHRRIDYFRALKLRLSILLFAPFAKFADQNAKKILVLRMDDKVGDSITATGFLRELKLAYPENALVVVAGSGSADIYRSLGFIDEVVVAKKGIIASYKLYKKLKNDYLYLINTSHILNPRVIFLTCLLPAFKKIGFGNSATQIFTDTVMIDFKRDHVTDRYRKALALTGANAHNLNYQLKLNPGDVTAAAKAILELRKSNKTIILLNSFAGGRLRNFSRETTEKIVSKLTENPDRVVISVANRGDHNILDNWIAKNSERWLHFRELHTLNQNLALASLCDLIVTPDTAWVHIASALKKKVVAVYRTDEGSLERNSAIWAPYKTYCRVIFAPLNEAGIADINTVDIEKVAERCEELLALNNSPIK